MTKNFLKDEVSDVKNSSGFSSHDWCDRLDLG